jgi:1-acyl-sn-glycerol-3-phosphate acyltransferase
MGIVYATSNLLLKTLLGIFGDWEVNGKENVPRKGALIIVANHISDIDAGILNASIPRRVEFMAKADLFQKPILSQLFRAYGAFPINENGTEFYSINHSLHILNRNGAIGIFPEGGKNPTALGQAMLGSAMIAMISGAPILPVGITGTESVGDGIRIFYPKGTFRINIGKPFYAPVVRGKRLRTNVETTTDIIMKQIAALLPECYRGVYHNAWKGKRSYTSPPNWSSVPVSPGSQQRYKS